MDTQLFASFGQVRIINLVDRSDRRREMISQLKRINAMAPNVSFFEARRPVDRGEFPSLGARGCFESHLSILRSARDDTQKSLLILEDDFDFTRKGHRQTSSLLKQLWTKEWDFFYGAHRMPALDRRGLTMVSANEPVQTTSFIALSGSVIPNLVDFFDAMLTRPAGSPDFGPMHVDGAYTVFRMLYPEFKTFAAFPPLGHQRSSRSDVTPTNMVLDQWTSTRSFGTILRRGYNLIARR